MKTTNLSRRHFMRASASIAGLGALAACVPMAHKLLNGETVESQKQYMVAVLDKYTGHTRHVKPEYIQLFADRFAETYGVVDYNRLFTGPIGEFRLIKLFLKSVFRPA